jgi:hypothetical protein
LKHLVKAHFRWKFFALECFKCCLKRLTIALERRFVL